MRTCKNFQVPPCSSVYSVVSAPPGSKQKPFFAPSTLAPLLAASQSLNTFHRLFPPILPRQPHRILMRPLPERALHARRQPNRRLPKLVPQMIRRRQHLLPASSSRARLPADPLLEPDPLQNSKSALPATAPCAPFFQLPEKAAAPAQKFRDPSASAAPANAPAYAS